MKTEIMYQDKPSHWINIHWFIIAVGAASTGLPIMVIPILIYLYHFLDIEFWQYTYTNDSLIESRGPFSLTHDEVHYFRIKDIRLEEPFLMRLVGLSNIYIVSSDRIRPVIKLTAVTDGHQKREAIKQVTLETRKELGVKEYDFR